MEARGVHPILSIYSVSFIYSQHIILTFYLLIMSINCHTVENFYKLSYKRIPTLNLFVESLTREQLLTVITSFKASHLLFNVCSPCWSLL